MNSGTFSINRFCGVVAAFFSVISACKAAISRSVQKWDMVLPFPYFCPVDKIWGNVTGL